MTRPITTLRAANAARQVEWDPSDRITLSYRLNELAGETGEACNVGKKLERERLGIRGSRATIGQLAEELADVVICVDLVAMAEGIDLDQAVIDKFNATSAKVGLTTRMASATKVDRMLAGEQVPESGSWDEGALANSRSYDPAPTADTAVAHRFRFAGEILEGMTNGIRGDRLGALVRWALHGQCLADEQNALILAFQAPWVAAAEEGEFNGDTRAEAEKDIARISGEAAALAADVFAYAYRYPGPNGGAIRLNTGGQEINGSRPIETIRLFREPQGDAAIDLARRFARKGLGLGVPAPDGEAANGGERCPTCDTRDPARHPAIQSEGEVSLCPHAWHKGAADHG